MRFVDGRRKRDHARPSLDAVGIATTPVCTENLIRRNPCSCPKIPCSSDGERIICPARYALCYGGMKRTRKQLVWKETGGSLVRGHTRYEANAGQGKYEISPYSELQRNGSEPKFGGYSIRRYPTKTSTIKDARTLKSSAKTADEAKAMAQRDHERVAS